MKYILKKLSGMKLVKGQKRRTALFSNASSERENIPT